MPVHNRQHDPEPAGAGGGISRSQLDYLLDGIAQIMRNELEPIVAVARVQLEMLEAEKARLAAVIPTPAAAPVEAKTDEPGAVVAPEDAVKKGEKKKH